MTVNIKSHNHPSLSTAATAPEPPPWYEAFSEISDEDIIGHVRGGNDAMFEVIMRRHNRRLFLTAYSVTKNRDDAEDIVQETYVRAYSKLDQFTGTGRFVSWLTRIALHEALGRQRRHKPSPLATHDLEKIPTTPNPAFAARPDSPEQSVSDRQLGQLLERAIERLPVHFRNVFVLRALEDLSTAETAENLGITQETVKTRFHRAKRLLQSELRGYYDIATQHAYPFAGEHCNRIVANVLSRIMAPADVNAVREHTT